MKKAAIIALVLCLAAAAGLGYLAVNARVTAEFVACIATDAVTQTDYFNQLKESVQNGSFTGTRFTQEVPDQPETSLFYSYRVRLTNTSRLPVETAELQVSPMEGDLLQIGDLSRRDLPSGSSLELAATILTARDSQNVRELTVSYYIWGIPFQIRLTAGGS